MFPDRCDMSTPLGNLNLCSPHQTLPEASKQVLDDTDFINRLGVARMVYCSKTDDGSTRSGTGVRQVRPDNESREGPLLAMDDLVSPGH